MAALISAYTGYILLSFLPTALWLLFYLREDRKHPEPKHLLVAVFFGGIGVALLSIVAEFLLVGDIRDGRGGVLTDAFPSVLKTTLGIFLLVGIIEEYFKYAAVKAIVVGRTEFDEPIDAMIYMMTSAMGFAALENVFFAVPLFRESFMSGLEVVTNRFLGANLLHALSSAIVGFFIAKSFLSPYHHHFVAAGIILASGLHLAFNYLILVSGTVSLGYMYLIFLLLVMTIMVLIEFEQLKRKNVNLER